MKKNTSLPLGLISVALVALLAGCDASGLQGSSQTFSGYMTVPDKAFALEDSEPEKAGDPCHPYLDTNDYPDIQAGTSVTLRDSAGEIVGLTSLQDGTLVNGWSDDGSGLSSVSDDSCSYKFVFEEVESSDDFFSVEVGNRGQVEVTREDLELGLVFLSLGG